MSSQQSIEKFRSFIRRHPKLRDEVLSGQKTWQEIYEDWVVLGENNERFTPYKHSQREWVDQISHVVKNIDFQNVQKHIGQLDQTIQQLQKLLEHFQGNDKRQTQPISYRKD